MPADASTSSPSVDDLQRRIDELGVELRARTSERDEGLRREAASAELLQIINNSPGALGPVFDAMVDKAMTICGAAFGALINYDGRSLTATSMRNYPPAFREFWREPLALPSESAVACVLRDKQTLFIPDFTESDAYRRRLAMAVAAVELGGVRSIIWVPLVSRHQALGVFVLYWQHVHAISQTQIALLESFAAQAVIAMENARLLGELHQRTDDLTESLEYQTATSQVLEVIGRSTSDIQPVLDEMLGAALRLCRTESGGIAIQQGGGFRYVAILNWNPEADKAFRSMEIRPGRGTVAGRALAEGRVVQVEDVASDPEFERPDMARLSQWHTALGVPLMQDGRPIGAIAITRDRIEPFTERQIALVRTFADQAVIAMENARLLDELRGRTRELQGALDYQTAISEVIQVISRSTFDLAPVLQTLAETALRLCEADLGFVCRREGDVYRVVTAAGSTAEAESSARTYQQYQQHHLLAADRSSLTGRVALEKRPVQITDVTVDPDYQLAQAPALGGIRTQVGVPLMREGELIGVIIVSRQRVEPFSEQQIGLLRVFADQAVIAIENTRLFTEQHEALDRQTATTEVLEIINGSPGNLQPVFSAMLERAVRLSESAFGIMSAYGDGNFRVVATRNTPDGLLELWSETGKAGPSKFMARVLGGEDVIHIADLSIDQDYLSGDARGRFLVERAGARSLLLVALRRDGELLGTITAYRQETQPFSEKQIALLQNFAAQAVIAMENARLLSEVRRREQELSVTFEHMGDGVVMFDGQLHIAAWNRNFQELLDISDAFLATRPSLDDYVRLMVERGEVGHGNLDEEVVRYRGRAGAQWSTERIRPDGRTIEVRNNPVPGGGAVLIYSDISERKKAEAEIRAARDVAEAALERQTATADILKVIAGSPTDVQPVLDALVKAAVRFCGATDATISLRDGNEIVRKAHEGPLGASIGARRPLDGDSASAKAINSGHTIHYQDISALDPVEFAGAHERARQDGYRAALAAPMIRDGVAVGNIALRKVEAGAFAPQQVALLETFAAQAVIAIENVRLFTELREALEQQTATAEILRAISQSPTDVQPVLDAVVKAAVRFCGASDASITLREEAEISIAAHAGNVRGEPLGTRTTLDRNTSRGRAILDGATVHLPDVLTTEPSDFGRAKELARMLGHRSIVSAPMMRDDDAIGCITLRKAEPEPFAPRQIELLETFAAQAVIAIENVRLFTELRDSLDRLKAAQANLIQAEKMASLGQLTAGIAHEIKNPLNFVNNFAGLSIELLDELKEAVAALLAEPDEERRAELRDTMNLLTGNLAKIVEHGRRADGIVKSMLSHSRGGTGDWQESNINALVEEALNLAYHGARAQDKDFNVTLERDLAPAARWIEVVPQDVTRVFLNLFGNGFYAIRKRHLAGADPGYRPTLRVSTRDLGETVEIRVHDNGIGIASEVRDKLFQPFFTTKPTGEGTGLGLSISYDIVTQQHGGTIEVESEPGQFTEFMVRLPRARRAAGPGSNP